MLDNASNTLKEYWDNLTYDENPVILIPKKVKRKQIQRSVEKLVKNQQLKTWNQMKNLLLHLERNLNYMVDMLIEISHL